MPKSVLNQSLTIKYKTMPSTKLKVFIQDKENKSNLVVVNENVKPHQLGAIRLKKLADDSPLRTEDVVFKDIGAECGATNFITCKTSKKIELIDGYINVAKLTDLKPV